MSVNGDNVQQDHLVDEIFEQAEQEVISYLPECDEGELTFRTPNQEAAHPKTGEVFATK